MLNSPAQTPPPLGPGRGTGGTARAVLYLALVGAATLLLLPLQGAFVAAPARAGAAPVVAAREGRFDHSLKPGESRTYVLELAGHGLLQVRFRGAGADLGLRIEDATGQALGATPAAGPERCLRVANPSASSRSLFLTVHRQGSPAPRRSPLPKDGELARAAGSYVLELERGVMP